MSDSKTSNSSEAAPRSLNHLRPTAIKGILSDLDGTLISSEKTYLEAYRKYFIAQGWPATDADLRIFQGRVASDVFASTPGPWQGQDPFMLSKATKAMIDLDTYPLEIYPKAKELLQLPLKIGIVTSAWKAWGREALRLLEAPESVILVTAEDVSRGKPDPQGYLQGAALLGLTPQECCVLEDTPAGIAAAVAAGVKEIFAITTTTTGPVLEQAGASAVFDSLEQAYQQILSFSTPPV